MTEQSVFTQERFAAAHRETERLSRELDITNADHVALWLEANVGDASLGWLAVRIVEAHEAAPDDITCAGSEGAREAYERGIWAATVWLRDQQHERPPATLWSAAAILADRMNAALLPARSDPVVDGAAEVRRLALEEAAKVAELWARRWGTSDEHPTTAAGMHIAAAVRALITPTAGNGEAQG